MARYHANEKTDWGSLLLKNFAGGLMWGLGTVIGATVVLSFFVNGLRRLDFIPIIADAVHEIQTAIESREH